MKNHKDLVVFNVKSGKYREPSCQWAYRYTQNGYYMERSDTMKKGIPCKVCH